MLQPIEGLPPNVVAFEASGHVVAEDYRDVLDPTVEAALGAHDKIRFLYVLGNNFEGYSGGAIWQDSKVGLEHWTRWEKIALVTDHHGYHDAVRAFAWLVPGEVNLYSVADLDAAKEWIAD